ncbi:hypothetical protein [Halalkalibacillus sediminis]|nr:hypothetical protein [Halalkalibacillus sediminis]
MSIRKAQASVYQRINWRKGPGNKGNTVSKRTDVDLLIVHFRN